MKEYYEELLKQLNIKENIQELDKQRGLINEKNIGLTMEISNKEQELSNLEAKYNKLKKSIFQKLRNNKSLKDIEIQITNIKKEIEELKIELNKNKQQISDINKKIENFKLSYKKEYDNFEDLVTIDDKVITIRDTKTINTIPANNYQDVMVHVTDLIPKNKTITSNYDGNKTITYYIDNIKNKKIECLSHRHTVHFAINSVVENTPMGEGKWNNKKYVIIEPLKNHKKQFVTDTNDVGISDNFTYGSVKLEDKPILIVREDAYKEIPKEEYDNYIIIKYSGNLQTCVKNILATMGIKARTFNPSDTIHSISLEKKQEECLELRDILIKIIKNPDYNGKDNIVLNKQELFSMYDLIPKLNTNVVFTTNLFSKSLTTITKDKQIPLDFIMMMTSYGIENNKDNYTFKTDDILYQDLKRLDEASKKIKNQEELNKYIKSTYNFDEIEKTYKEYQTYQENNNKNMLNELHKLLGDKTEITITKKGIDIEYPIDQKIYDIDKLESMGLNINKKTRFDFNNKNNKNGKVEYQVINQSINGISKEILYEKVKKLATIIKESRKQLNIPKEQENPIKR